MIAERCELEDSSSYEFDEISPDDIDNADVTSVCIPTLLKIAHKLAKVEANQKMFDRRMEKIEVAIGLISDALSIDNSMNAIKSKVTPVNKESPGELVSRFKQIRTLQALNVFEQNLKNPVFHKESLRSNILKIISTFPIQEFLFNLQLEKLILVCNDATLSETNLAYSIVDVMFTRQLFEHISWTGGSKSGIQKAALQAYKRVLAFFIELLRVCHPNYPENRVHEFFKKKILSCAISRAKQPRQRLSREKNRKRTAYPDLDDDGTDDENATSNAGSASADADDSLMAAEIVSADQSHQELVFVDQHVQPPTSSSAAIAVPLQQQ